MCANKITYSFHYLESACFNFHRNLHIEISKYDKYFYLVSVLNRFYSFVYSVAKFYILKRIWDFYILRSAYVIYLRRDIGLYFFMCIVKHTFTILRTAASINTNTCACGFKGTIFVSICRSCFVYFCSWPFSNTVEETGTILHSSQNIEYFMLVPRTWRI